MIHVTALLAREDPLNPSKHDEKAIAAFSPFRRLPTRSTFFVPPSRLLSFSSPSSFLSRAFRLLPAYLRSTPLCLALDSYIDTHSSEVSLTGNSRWSGAQTWAVAATAVLMVPGCSSGMSIAFPRDENGIIGALAFRDDRVIFFPGCWSEQFFPRCWDERHENDIAKFLFFFFFIRCGC